MSRLKSGLIIGSAGAVGAANVALHYHNKIKQLPDQESYKNLIAGYRIPVPASPAIAINTTLVSGKHAPYTLSSFTPTLSALCRQNPQPIIQAVTVEKEQDAIVRATTHTWAAHAHADPAYYAQAHSTVPSDIAFLTDLSQAQLARLRCDKGFLHKFHSFAQSQGIKNRSITPKAESICKTAAGKYHVSLGRGEHGDSQIFVQLQPSPFMRSVAALRAKRSASQD